MKKQIEKNIDKTIKDIEKLEIIIQPKLDQLRGLKDQLKEYYKVLEECKVLEEKLKNI